MRAVSPMSASCVISVFSAPAGRSLPSQPSRETGAASPTFTVKSMASRSVASPVRPLMTTLYLRARSPAFLILKLSRLYSQPGSQRILSCALPSLATHLRAPVSSEPSALTISTSRSPDLIVLTFAVALSVNHANVEPMSIDTQITIESTLRSNALLDENFFIVFLLLNRFFVDERKGTSPLIDIKERYSAK